MSSSYRYSSPPIGTRSYAPLSPPADSHPYQQSEASTDLLPAYDAPPSLSLKGKGRASRGSFDDETDDGMAWEPSASTSDRIGRTAGSHQGERRPSGVSVRKGDYPLASGGVMAEARESVEELDELEAELGGGIDEEGEKRRKARLWWHAAMINVLFIAAW